VVAERQCVGAEDRRRLELGARAKEGVRELGRERRKGVVRDGGARRLL
jgi:hypothetical protein